MQIDAQVFLSTVTASNLTGTNTGDVTIGTANGLSLVGQAVSLAEAVAAGVSGALTGADKTKLDALTGTNTGNVTLAAVGSTPAAEGASLSGQVITLQPASATHPGLVTTGTQTIAGAKTFSGGLTSTVASGGTALVLTTGAYLALNVGQGAWLRAVTNGTTITLGDNLTMSGTCAAGTVTASGKVLATGGIGVGNSTTASAIGALNKVIQVFDAAGVAQGYVAVSPTFTP